MKAKQRPRVSDNLIALGEALQVSFTSYSGLQEGYTPRQLIDASTKSSVALRKFLSRDLPEYYAPIIELVNDYLPKDLSRVELTLLNDSPSVEEINERSKGFFSLLMNGGEL